MIASRAQVHGIDVEHNPNWLPDFVKEMYKWHIENAELAKFRKGIVAYFFSCFFDEFCIL